MDYPYPTVSKPAKGKAAEEIKKAIETGGSIMNEAAKATIESIVAEHRKKLKDEQAKKQVRGD